MSKTTIFHNGNFHTMKEDQPTLSAVICRDGKMADFTVFDIDPYENNMHAFQRMHASMIVVGGEIVYNANDELMSELYDLLVSQAV